jgi:NADH-quinone oxidoreductase E subunit
VNQLAENYREEIQEILKRYPPEQKRSAVMPLLFLAQRETNFINDQSILDISEILQVSPTDVASIAGFYSLFHQEPGGHYRIQVCTDLPCALRGADGFLKELSEYLSVEVGETTPDGLFTLEEVKCLAACDHAPMFQLQGKGTISYHQDQTIETAKIIIEGIRQNSSWKMEGKLT